MNKVRVKTKPTHIQNKGISLKHRYLCSRTPRSQADTLLSARLFEASTHMLAALSKIISEQNTRSCTPGKCSFQPSPAFFSLLQPSQLSSLPGFYSFVDFFIEAY